MADREDDLKVVDLGNEKLAGVTVRADAATSRWFYAAVAWSIAAVATAFAFLIVEFALHLK